MCTAFLFSLSHTPTFLYLTFSVLIYHPVCQAHHPRSYGQCLGETEHT
jgi:hypothetical protein